MRFAFLNSKKACIRSNVKMLSNPLPGLEIGIPLSITENIFTNLHYDYDITSIEGIFRQCCVGYFCYGSDRFFDSFSSNIDFLPERKKKLYAYYNRYRLPIVLSLITTYAYLIYEFNQQAETVPFELLITSTLLYRPFKQKYGEIKALYIAILWTMAVVIIPCVFHDGNYDILNYPLDYIPCFFSIYGGSTTGDMLDIEEDKNNNISTIPVKFGNKKAYISVLLSIITSNILFAFNSNFVHRFFINSVFELQNTGTLLIPFVSNISWT